MDATLLDHERRRGQLEAQLALVVPLLERIDGRLDALEADASTLKTDVAAIKDTTADTNRRVRVHGFGQ